MNTEEQEKYIKEFLRNAYGYFEGKKFDFEALQKYVNDLFALVKKQEERKAKAEKPTIDQLDARIKAIEEKYDWIQKIKPTDPDLKLVNKPLFKTEDGVDIFPHDTYWFVSSDYITSGALAMSGEYSNEAKRFSTEKAAKDYIYWNKPIISMDEIRKILTDSLHSSGSTALENAATKTRELAQSKFK